MPSESPSESYDAQHAYSQRGYFKWLDCVRCSSCGKRVSNYVCGHDDEGLVVRAWVECPECVVNSPHEPKGKD